MNRLSRFVSWVSFGLYRHLTRELWCDHSWSVRFDEITERGYYRVTGRCRKCGKLERWSA